MKSTRHFKSHLKQTICGGDLSAFAVEIRQCFHKKPDFSQHSEHRTDVSLTGGGRVVAERGGWYRPM